VSLVPFVPFVSSENNKKPPAEAIYHKETILSPHILDTLLTR
jgi:hypothetical protein